MAKKRATAKKRASTKAPAKTATAPASKPSIKSASKRPGAPTAGSSPRKSIGAKVGRALLGAVSLAGYTAERIRIARQSRPSAQPTSPRPTRPPGTRRKGGA